MTDRGQIVYRSRNIRWCPKNGAFMPIPEDEAQDELRAQAARSSARSMAAMVIGFVAVLGRDSIIDAARAVWSLFA